VTTAWTSPKVTELIEERFVPVIVTVYPPLEEPEVGFSEAMVGALVHGWTRDSYPGS